ncbi:MAG: hypothetical protein EA381_18685 [Planctomycetaceae bacterium]|nr:MAG: hypothetical protein EA381_18685 [Planctomycetaceae bacterium]
MPRPQLTIRSLLVLVAVVGFGLSYFSNLIRMRAAESELTRLRQEVGFLDGSEANEIAAVRVPAEEPLTWRTRIRVPRGQAYRLAYSAIWAEATAGPDWFAAQPIPAGESTVTIRVIKDPRDDRWKITSIIRHADGIARIGTTLPDEISEIFRGTHDVMSTGVGKQTVTCPVGQSLRILDERYFSGSSLLLYGDSGPRENLVGVYAELQPDIGPLPRP